MNALEILQRCATYTSQCRSELQGAECGAVVCTQLRTLVELGLLDVEDDGPGRRRWYTLTLPGEMVLNAAQARGRASDPDPEP